MPEVNGTAGAEVAADTEAPAMPAIPPGPDPAVKAKEVPDSLRIHFKLN